MADIQDRDGFEWPHFDRYRLEKGLLIVDAGAAIEWRYPWRDYLATREIGMSRRGPHEELLKLVTDLRFVVRSPGPGFVPDARSVESLVDWCSRWGLLGIGLSSIGGASSPSKKGWRGYQEALSDFLDAALELRSALGLFAGRAEWTRPDTQDLVDALVPVASGTATGAPPAGSLLQMFWAMTLQDAMAGGAPRSCEVCETLFLTRSRRAKYCSSTCRETAQKRARRGRQQNQENE